MDTFHWLGFLFWMVCCFCSGLCFAGQFYFYLFIVVFDTGGLFLTTLELLASSNTAGLSLAFLALIAILHLELLAVCWKEGSSSGVGLSLLFSHTKREDLGAVVTIPILERKWRHRTHARR
jgi:hypothetical protein